MQTEHMFPEQKIYITILLYIYMTMNLFSAAYGCFVKIDDTSDTHEKADVKNNKGRLSL